MEKLTSDQLYKVSRILQDGHYGSFMSAVGSALQVADSGNMEKLYKAFGDKFERVYAQAMQVERTEAESTLKRDIEQATEEAAERHMNRLDKKLMQGHITQDEYDRRVAEIDNWVWKESIFSK